MNANTLSTSTLLVFLLFVMTSQGCFVRCPMSFHCKTYYDLTSGCSWCICSDKLVKEICPNRRMVCPRNCPPQPELKFPGCFKCSCMLPGLPVRFMRGLL